MDVDVRRQHKISADFQFLLFVFSKNINFLHYFAMAKICRRLNVEWESQYREIGLQ
jgi:hypothetical protein